MPKVLLTGASGGLGGALLPYLAARPEMELRALVHRAPVKESAVQSVRGGLDDHAALAEATCGVDTVVHMAAVTHTCREEDYFRVNEEGTGNLLVACRRSGVKRFVHISTRAVNADGGAYALSKLRAEEAVMNSGLPWIIVRPAEVYGKGSPDAINKLVGWVRKFKVIPVIGDGQYKLSPVFIEDFTPALGQIIERDDWRQCVVTLGGPEDIAFDDLVQRVAALLELGRYAVHIPVWLAKGMVEVMLLLGGSMVTRDQIPRLLCAKPKMDVSALRDFHYHPRRLEDGLRSYLFVRGGDT